jgi:hypothetical protein
MEWLTQMLGMGNQANQGSSPFGALGAKLGGMLPGGMGGQPGQPPGAPPPMQGGGPLPFMGPQGQPSAAAGAPPPIAPGQSPGLWNPQGGQQNNAMLGQAMNLLKGPQMQPTQWMPWMGK